MNPEDIGRNMVVIITPPELEKLIVKWQITNQIGKIWALIDRTPQERISLWISARGTPRHFLQLCFSDIRQYFIRYHYIPQISYYPTIFHLIFFNVSADILKHFSDILQNFLRFSKNFSDILQYFKSDILQHFSDILQYFII